MLTSTTRGHAAGDDGFLDRWLLCWPDEDRPRTPEGAVPADLRRMVDELFVRLWGTPEFTSKPHRIGLSPDARAEWAAAEATYFAALGLPGPDWWDGPSAKMRAYTGRLAMVVAMARMASADALRDLSAMEVTGTDMRAARTLGAYFSALTLPG